MVAMEEPMELDITVELVDSETGEVLDEVERTLFLMEEEDEDEEIATGTLDDLLTGLVEEIREACEESQLKLIYEERLYIDLAINIVLSVMRENWQVVVKAPVTKVEPEEEGGGEDEEEQEE